MIADEAAVAGEPGDLLILGHNVHLECDHTGRVYMLCPGCGRFVPHAVATPEDDKPGPLPLDWGSAARTRGIGPAVPGAAQTPHGLLTLPALAAQGSHDLNVIHMGIDAYAYKYMRKA